MNIKNEDQENTHKSNVEKHYKSDEYMIEAFRSKIIDLYIIQWMQERYSSHLMNIEEQHKQSFISDINDGNVHPSILHIIQLGVSFDSRFERLFLSSEAIADSDQNSRNMQSMINRFPNGVQKSDYDIVYYYEIDIPSVIEIRKQLFNEHKIQQKIFEFNNKHLLCKNSGRLKVNKIHRYLYCIHSWKKYLSNAKMMDEFVLKLKTDILSNNRKHNRLSIKHMHNLDDICFVCESLFSHLDRNEIKSLMDAFCDQFIGSHMICEESMPAGKWMMRKFRSKKSVVEHFVIKSHNFYCYLMHNKVMLLQMKEIYECLEWWVKCFLLSFIKYNYKIFVVQFIKQIKQKIVVRKQNEKGIE